MWPRSVDAVPAGRQLEVATCIACGARSRFAECVDGCDDVPLDLVELESEEALAAELGRLDPRVSALREVAESLCGESGDTWLSTRARARDALRIPSPAHAVDETGVVEAWGCPACGRVDAPQPCLGVCVRRPVLMVDAERFKGLAAAVAAGRSAERRLSEVVRLAANIAPRDEQVEQTRTWLRSRARAALHQERS